MEPQTYSRVSQVCKILGSQVDIHSPLVQTNSQILGFNSPN